MIASVFINPVADNSWHIFIYHFLFLSRILSIGRTRCRSKEDKINVEARVMGMKIRGLLSFSKKMIFSEIIPSISLYVLITKICDI